MELLNRNNFVLTEQKKDLKWDYVYKTLTRPEAKIRKDIPWINQPKLDWNVQVL